MSLATACLLAAALGAYGGADSPRIPPGQEDLLLEMLGKKTSLPGSCKLEDGRVEYTVVEATYACSLGEVIVELAHASEATDTDVQTEHFAIAVLDGSAPNELIDTLAARVQQREASFVWEFPADPATPE